MYETVTVALSGGDVEVSVPQKEPDQPVATLVVSIKTPHDRKSFTYVRRPGSERFELQGASPNGAKVDLWLWSDGTLKDSQEPFRP